MYFDSHCHINAPAFADDLDDVLGRAAAAGVATMLVVGYDLATSQRAVEIAADCPAAYPSAGLHPFDAKQLDEDARHHLGDMYARRLVCAVGETGIDLAGRGYPPLEDQLQAFRWHLDRAEEFSMPVIIHQRESAGVIAAELKGRSVAGVMHCWSLGAEPLDAFLSAGFYVSFAGLLTYRSAETVRQAAGQVPADRLLIETDSPYLTPSRTGRRRRNEPANLPLTAALLAELRGITASEIADITTTNAKTLFGVA